MEEIVVYLSKLLKADNKNAFLQCFDTTQTLKAKKLLSTMFATKDQALKLVKAFWGLYDLDNNGVLDRGEARLLVNDIVKELQEDYAMVEFGYLQNFNEWFSAVDSDMSNTIDQNECAEFILKLLKQTGRTLHKS